MTAIALATKTDSQIDARMAESILDELGYTLEDVSLSLGDVVIEDGDISHQLYYGTDYSTAQILGYVRVENGIYFTHLNNYRSPEEAALELIPQFVIKGAIERIESRKSEMPDYM